MHEPTFTPLLIAGISGSLRRGSYNTSLLEIAGSLVPGGVDFRTADLRDIPMYNADVERESGFPEPVQRFRDLLAAADAIIIATPEYNWSVPGVLKNAIDWASRGPESPLDHKPAAILGAGGRSGTARAQRHLREILGHNKVAVLAEPEVLVAGAWEQFTSEGELRDDAIVERIGRLVNDLVEAAEKRRTALAEASV